MALGCLLNAPLWTASLLKQKEVRHRAPTFLRAGGASGEAGRRRPGRVAAVVAAGGVWHRHVVVGGGCGQRGRQARDGGQGRPRLLVSHVRRQDHVRGHGPGDALLQPAVHRAFHYLADLIFPLNYYFVIGPSLDRSGHIASTEVTFRPALCVTDALLMEL